MMASQILVVDDDAGARQYLSLLLRENGHRVTESADGVEAVLAIEKDPPDLVISDLRMPEMDGLELLAHVKGRWPELPVVLLTVVEDIATVVRSIQSGAVNYLIKPASPSVLMTAVTRALGIAAVNPQPQRQIAEIVGNSKSMIEVRRLVSLAASIDVNVLITGETGTGKELVARAIHKHSSLRDGPFVAHNCAATPQELFESHFFGHRRGAFTGALEDHVGLLEQGSGGVLLLDELHTLNDRNQSKLLRVLDDGEVRPVGSSQVRPVSVRFLATTNGNPQQLIAQRILREDLYYRLQGLEILMPPLRERPRDIPLLARHFLGPEGGEFTPEALEALCRYAWPGNVRQLRNAVRSAKALAGKGRIDLAHLVLEGNHNGKFDNPSLNPGTTNLGRVVPLKEMERQAILEALKTYHGNLSQTARVLGIDRSTLRRKIRELDQGLGGNN